MGLKQKTMKAMVGQFLRPHGLGGRAAGWVMAKRGSNRERNIWAVGLLDVQPHDRVLEIGFGPGIAIQEFARHATSGLVVGVDHSEVMVRQARKRNAAAVQSRTRRPAPRLGRSVARFRRAVRQDPRRQLADVLGRPCGAIEGTCTTGCGRVDRSRSSISRAARTRPTRSRRVPAGRSRSTSRQSGSPTCASRRSLCSRPTPCACSA